MKKKWIQKYILEMKNALEVEKLFGDTKQIYDVIRRGCNVLGEEWNIHEDDFFWKDVMAPQDGQLFIEKLEYYGDYISTMKDAPVVREEALIFLSHKSDDILYGNALRDFIVGLGVKDNQLIYSSHPLHKIPLDASIYDYLREHIYSNVLMLFLFSDNYLESPACLNEMGAAWIMRNDYTNIFIPGFNFNNPKFNSCAVDKSRVGINLGNHDTLKTAMLEFKNKICNMFNLTVKETKVNVLLDEFVEAINKANNEMKDTKEKSRWLI
ncbi:MAG: toll/interleukin-1 receptor domain-containing protein [Firmicutes bacterium]|nr:toll/interleukin-1 receptor domain-containing protein [Bacillota bacterium]